MSPATYAPSDITCTLPGPIVFTMIKDSSNTIVLDKVSMTPSNAFSHTFIPTAADVGTFTYTVKAQIFDGTILYTENSNI